MAEATCSITIARSPDEVFALVSDPGRDAEWNPNTISVRNLSGETTGRGARYRGNYRGFGESELEVTTYDPPRKVTIAVTTKQGSGAYSFVISPTNGGAILRQEAYFSARGVMRLMDPLMRRMLAGRLKQLSQEAKRCLEGTKQASP